MKETVKETKMKLYKHQRDALIKTKSLSHVAFYHEQGLGKTFTGSEKMHQLGAKTNLLICQKSKIDDWYEHFMTYYDFNPCNLTKVKADKLKDFIKASESVPVPTVFIINYDLVWRRKELLQLIDFTLMLDESSLIQNEMSNRSQFILKLKPDNVILLSGTPTSGKYENLWSQLHLLGWNISKELFYSHYICYHFDDTSGFPIRIIDGYKNVDRLKRKMRGYGCHFLKSDECIDLPDQITQVIKVPVTKEYLQFKKDRIVTVEDKEIVGDTLLTKLLYQRQLCGQYNRDKLDALRDLLESTGDRVIVFYSFNDELDKISQIVSELGRPISAVNGKEHDLHNYDEWDDSVTLIQYQAGAYGLNLQKANRVVYFTPPLSSELYEQSVKRIHRIGQSKTCFYYQLVCRDSVEERIYQVLAMRRDYTEELFKEEEGV